MQVPRAGGIAHAGTRNHRTRAPGCSRGQGADDPGWRIHPRRDSPYPRGQARRALDETSDRHRPFQSAPRRGEASAAETGTGQRPHAKAGRTRAPEGTETPCVEPVVEAGTGRARGAQARTALGGVRPRALPTRERGRAQTFETSAVRERETCRAYPSTSSLISRSARFSISTESPNSCVR